MNDLELMQIQARALFRLDDRGRMLSTNEPDPPTAPRLFWGRTRAGNLWRFRHDLPPAIVSELEILLRAEPVATDLTHPPHGLQAVQDVLARQSPVTETEMGPAWRFPEHLPRPTHDIVPITPENDAAVRAVFPRLAADLPWSQPCVAILRNGNLASICFSSRNTPAAAEAGLETLEPFRGRGYAAAVTAAWARAVRSEGRIPLYSTSWDNLASHAVARKLSLVLYGADLTID